MLLKYYLKHVVLKHRCIILVSFCYHWIHFPSKGDLSQLMQNYWHISFQFRSSLIHSVDGVIVTDLSVAHQLVLAVTEAAAVQEDLNSEAKVNSNPLKYLGLSNSPNLDWFKHLCYFNENLFTVQTKNRPSFESSAFPLWRM